MQQGSRHGHASDRSGRSGRSVRTPSTGRTRRSLLAAGALLAAGGLGGCADGLSAGEPAADGGGAFTTFYTLEQFTREVVGNAMAVANPVPAGEMGHRYEAGNQEHLEAARSAAFVYLDVPGFQNWARIVADSLRDEHRDVTVVDALEGVTLRSFDGGDAHGGGDDGDGDHGGGDDGDGDHGGGEHGDGEQGDDDHSGGAHGDGDNGDGDHEGDGDGEDGTGGDHGDGDDHDGPDDRGGGHAGHDHADVDPHYWLDPLRAAESVATIADGLASADPSRAETYRENAAAYVDELESLDREIGEALADRGTDLVVMAGHDSYQYLAARYDFRIHSPVGVSPNVEPSTADVAETIALVDEHDLDVVLYDAFASPALAETIVRESGASEAVPVSPLEGTKPEWADRNWGYVDQMREVNLPALEAALEAS